LSIACRLSILPNRVLSAILNLPHSPDLIRFMERKYFIIIAFLLISLAGGIFILIRQNGGLNNLQASLTGQNNNWWQIEPRVKMLTSTNETAAKNSLSSAKNSTKLNRRQ